MGPLIIMGDGQLALYSDCLLFCWLSFLKTMQSYSALFNVTYRKYCFCSSVFKFNRPKIYHNKKWSLTKIMSDSGLEGPNLTAMLTVCLTIQIKDLYWLDMEIFESIKMIWLLRAVEMTVPLSWGNNSLCQILVTISPVPTLLPSLLKISFFLPWNQAWLGEKLP